jgi:hypothetical protein
VQEAAALLLEHRRRIMTKLATNVFQNQNQLSIDLYEQEVEFDSRTDQEVQVVYYEAFYKGMTEAMHGWVFLYECDWIKHGKSDQLSFSNLKGILNRINGKHCFWQNDATGRNYILVNGEPANLCLTSSIGNISKSSAKKLATEYFATPVEVY